MGTVMKASEFVKKLEEVAKNYKTLYIMGCFGAPMNSKNKTRYCSNHSYNKAAARTKMIQAATADTFGFDCVCLIKGVLWGWCGDKSRTYGGASYAVNGVPDINADQMIKVCSGVTTDFSTIEVGEAVWTTGHIGVYIGNGLAVECTPKWSNCVQITACNCVKPGYNTRNWKKHGKLPYINYDVKSTDTTKPQPSAPVETKTDEKAIWDFLFAKIGNACGVAGLMGNLYAESALRPNNLQNSYENKLGFTDSSYTTAVDNGSYDNFVRDSAGYGLAQWTYWSRKEALLKYAQGKKESIGDLTTQLEFLYKELSESYKAVLSTLKTAKTVRAASDAVLIKYECPANMGDSVQIKRAEYGQKYYDKYASTENVPTEITEPTTSAKVDYAQKRDDSLAGNYAVTASVGLHIRTGASTKKASLGVLTRGTVVRNYGYYSVASNGVKWLYVQAPDGTVGFCSSTYLKKS